MKDTMWINMERNNNYDLKLAGYIWSILRTRPIVMMSWGIERKIIEDVYFDMLVSVIDENVEKTDDYEKRISEEYGIIRE